MALPPLNATFNLSRALLDIREQENDLQRQLATGKKSTTYGGLEEQRGIDLSFRGELSQIEGYQASIDHVQIRLDLTNEVLGRIREIGADTKTDALGSLFDTQNNDRTSFQDLSEAKFSEMIALLNQQIAGRYIFSGRETDQVPVLSPSDILDGTAGRAGFRQVASERVEADLGADNLGRLVVPVPTGSSVTLTEDNASSPFGFKLNTPSSTLTGTTVSGPTGSPEQVSVTFSSTLPQDGESVKLNFDLPDGTTASLELTARSSDAGGVNEFLIGADENETATNFQSVLSTALQSLAKSDLQAASMLEAADNFFDFDSTTQPQRVNGSPANTATSLTDATTSNTIYWYQGEVSSTTARDSSLAKIDDTISLGHGARANESAFKTILKQLAVVVSDSYPESDTDGRARYLEISERVNTALSFNGNVQSVDSITAEFTVIQATLESSRERHVASADILQSLIDEIEVADTYEVSAQLLSLQTRLQATLSVTASLGRISLVNFL